MAATWMMVVALLVVGPPGAQPAKAATTASAAAGAVQTVKIGFYPLHVYELDLGGNSYALDFCLWLAWSGDIDPTRTIDFTNMVDESVALKNVMGKEPQVLPDGTKYQLFEVEGRFVQPFHFENFPFDRQQLTVEVADSLHAADRLKFVIDDTQTAVDEKLEIPGWEIVGLTSRVATKSYRSTFGINAASPPFSRATFTIEIRRPANLFYWKLLMPLGIILLAGLLALLLPTANIDSRAALLGGSLLTAIFLQKTYADALPDCGYIVLMDKIYLLAYAAIILSLGRVTLSYTTCHGLSAAALARRAQFDRRLFAALIAAFGIGCAILVLTRTASP